MVEQLQLCIQKDSGDEKYMEVELWLHSTHLRVSDGYMYQFFSTRSISRVYFRWVL